MYLYINTAVAGLNSRCGLIDDKGIFMVLPKIFIIWWHYIINQATSTAFTYHHGCGLLLSFMDSIRRYNTQAWVIITCRYCAHMQLYMYMQIYTGTHYLCSFGLFAAWYCTCTYTCYNMYMCTSLFSLHSYQLSWKHYKQSQEGVVHLDETFYAMHPL